MIQITKEQAEIIYHWLWIVTGEGLDEKCDRILGDYLKEEIEKENNGISK